MPVFRPQPLRCRASLTVLPCWRSPRPSAPTWCWRRLPPASAPLAKTICRKPWPRWRRVAPALERGPTRGGALAGMAFYRPDPATRRARSRNFAWAYRGRKKSPSACQKRPLHLPPLNICLQVNISGEASKSGWRRRRVMAARAIVNCCGCAAARLMAIPGADRGSAETARGIPPDQELLQHYKPGHTPRSWILYRWACRPTWRWRSKGHHRASAVQFLTT